MHTYMFSMILEVSRLIDIDKSGLLECDANVFVSLLPTWRLADYLAAPGTLPTYIG